MTNEELFGTLCTRFDQVEERWYARIDLVEQRLNEKIDQVEERLSARIDEVEQRLNARIDEVEQRLNARIDEVEQRLDARIDQLELRLTEVQQRLDARIDHLEEDMNRWMVKIESITQQNMLPRMDVIQDQYENHYKSLLQLPEKVDQLCIDMKIVKQVVERHSVQLKVVR